MREVFSDFMVLDDRPDGTIRVPLGAESSASDLAGLSDGEAVLLVYPGNLRAPAIVQSEAPQGERYWFGTIASWDAIEDIHGDTAVGMQDKKHTSVAQD
jgi:hypothetical protein